MAENVYPLIYKPGIQRDGTPFQPVYCTSAQWVRFQRGKARRMGGMKGISLNRGGGHPNIQNITNIMELPSGGARVMVINHERGIEGYFVDSNFNRVNHVTYLDQYNPLLRWQTIKALDRSTLSTYIIFMGCPDLNNILSDAPPILYAKNINSLPDAGVTSPFVALDPRANGGMCFASPYLFVYGNEGIIQYSNSNNIFDFTPGVAADEADTRDAGTITLTTPEKIIYGTPIRGGSNSPSLLFWTTNSVVRVTNIGLTDVRFFAEPISTSCTIMSSRSVVEHGSLFYWAGTDGFYYFNGLVDTLENNMNFNYFFDNIDLAQCQKIFGSKITKYNEICWFYPARGQQSATRVIIYNYKLECWYDTDLSRSAALYSTLFGTLLTAGIPLQGNEPGYNYLWLHEEGDAEIWESVPQAIQRQESIDSSLTTPIFSFIAFPPGAPNAPLVNRWMDLNRIEPNFLGSTNTGLVSTLDLTVNTQEYSQNIPVAAYTIAFTSRTEKVDLHVQARNISLTFSSEDAWEMGNNLLIASMGDER